MTDTKKTAAILIQYTKKNWNALIGIYTFVEMTEHNYIRNDVVIVDLALKARRTLIFLPDIYLNLLSMIGLYVYVQVGKQSITAVYTCRHVPCVWTDKEYNVLEYLFFQMLA